MRRVRTVPEGIAGRGGADLSEGEVLSGSESGEGVMSGSKGWLYG